METIDYTSDEHPLADRIRAVDQAMVNERDPFERQKIQQWSMSLKAQMLRTSSQATSAVSDFRRDGDPMTLREHISAAEEAGDHDRARVLKTELLRLSAQPRLDRDAIAEQNRRQAEAFEARNRAAEEEAARTTALRRQQYDAIQSLPKEAREIAMWRTFGWPEAGCGSVNGDEDEDAVYEALVEGGRARTPKPSQEDVAATLRAAGEHADHLRDDPVAALRADIREAESRGDFGTSRLLKARLLRTLPDPTTGKPAATRVPDPAPQFGPWQLVKD